MLIDCMRCRTQHSNGFNKIISVAKKIFTITNGMLVECMRCRTQHSNGFNKLVRAICCVCAAARRCACTCVQVCVFGVHMCA
ncbi:hypothetical protein I3842_12G063500 [Carya illinoinensis]|uniref:Uncharacterized protein n=1 Tax=Carya illinoinensis TaxID=32201 RepID=A0A922DHG9_CARIL|nr:hypothetical protein I3842_12G063500 [Carya illinoinensis]